jgi:hypothetical protein
MRIIPGCSSYAPNRRAAPGPMTCFGCEKGILKPKERCPERVEELWATIASPALRSLE